MQLPRVLSYLRGHLNQKTFVTSKYIRLFSKDYTQVSPSAYKPQVPLIISMRGYCQPTSLPRDVTHGQLVDILDTKSAVVVDVRTPEELTRHGTIPGAINIPLGDLEVTSQGQHWMKDFLCFQTALTMRPKKLESLFNICIDERTPLVFSCMAGIR